MNKLKFLSISVAVATLILTGCGSSDDSTPTVPGVTTQTGTFVDAPVTGLSYTTATQSGFTDVDGNFKYVAGETVEFKLGNLSLGKSVASASMTPYTISDTNDTATNIALLLQNFDGNRINTNVLDLSKLKDYNFTASDFNLSATPATIKGKIEILFADNNFAHYRDDTNNSVLSSSDVKSNMDNFINSIGYTKKFTQSYLDTHVFYKSSDEYPQYKNKYENGEIYFAGDSENGSWDDNFDTASSTYTIVNGIINASFSNDGEVTVKILNVTNTYIEVFETHAVYGSRTSIWYTDKQAALNSLSQ